ncbi:hypothetical protein [Aeromonas phage Aes516]|nr:hypothetical protein [Aeromonas phage Aes516]
MKTIAVALLFVSSVASGASFDCTMPNLNAIEKAICKIPEISLLDDQMAEAYKVVAHIPEVKTDQRDFIKERNAMTSLSLLKDRMTDRIIELQIIAELEGVDRKPYSERTEVDVAKITNSKRIHKEGTVGDLIFQAKHGDELKFRGKTSYMDYRDKNAPIWMRDCAYRIVRNDVMGRWVAQARSAGLINEFKSVEYKIETGFINMTIDNLKMNIQKSRQVCETMVIGTTW